MTWPKRIQNLKPFVLVECKDIPPDLVLAIIKHESAGYIGRIAGTKCKSGMLPDVNGNTHVLNHAMGLMQVIPATVQWYNQTAPSNDQATVEDMTGKDERAARLQIRIGCMFLAFANKYLHDRHPKAAPAASLSEAKDDQIALVVTAYAVGHGATSKKLTAVKAAGLAPNYANIKRKFPTWGKNSAGKWINRPLAFADVIVKWYNQNKSGSFNTTPGKELAQRAVEGVQGRGAFAVILFVAGAGWMLAKHFSRRKEAKREDS